jgi:hypothetical protein
MILLTVYQIIMNYTELFTKQLFVFIILKIEYSNSKHVQYTFKTILFKSNYFFYK